MSILLEAIAADHVVKQNEWTLIPAVAQDTTMKLMHTSGAHLSHICAILHPFLFALLLGIGNAGIWALWEAFMLRRRKLTQIPHESRPLYTEHTHPEAAHSARSQANCQASPSFPADCCRSCSNLAGTLAPCTA